MEQSQKLNFLKKNSKNVADPPDQDFPNTVLLFEPRISVFCSTSHGRKKPFAAASGKVLTKKTKF